MSKGLLGPDGNPLQAIPRESESAAKEAMDAMQHPRLGKLSYSMVLSWRLFQYARSEIEQFGLSPAAIEIIVKSMSVKAQEHFSLTDMAKDYDKLLRPFLADEQQRSERQERKRKAKVIEIERKLPKEGFKLPSFEMTKQIKDGRYTLGSLFVVFGQDLRAQIHMLRNCGKSFVDQKFGVAYLGSQELIPVEGKVKTPSYATLYMPPAWWNRACTDRGRLNDVLTPLLKQSIQFLVVDDLTMAAALTEGDSHDAEKYKLKLQSALAMLHEWCINNKVALLVGIDVSRSAGADPKTEYTFLEGVYAVTAAIATINTTPAFSVVDTSGAPQVQIPEEKVIIGSDVFPLIEG